MNTVNIWQAKLAARIHDPAEKSLILLRDPAGHENGTSLALTRLLGLADYQEQSDPNNDQALVHTIFKRSLPKAVYKIIQKADWWAAAADRPQWPMQQITVTTKKGQEKTFAVAPWAQVRWSNKPVLIHPLTGEQFDLGKYGGLADAAIEDVKRRSFDHFSELLIKLGAHQETDQNFYQTLLTYWRFGPDLSVTDADTEDNTKLGKLWEVLPADTRVPDHSIWDHLDLTSAFAGAFAADPEGEVSLLTLSLGPVQPFIAASRSTSDLWAGSHLLSRLSWEAMRQVCEQLGPDAILFPRLRGIPQVDLWLRDEVGLPDELFTNCEWNQGKTDANPLFSAALPNRFVALVPKNQAASIAAAVEAGVKNWLAEQGEQVVALLLAKAGYSEEQESFTYIYEQMKEQLQDFPEVHWAAVPFSLIKCRNPERQTDLDITELSAAMAPFFNKQAEQGFLDTPAWQLLQKEMHWQDSTTFFAPNPGVLYPAVFDLAERAMAAAKTARSFTTTKQEGWRCTLTGENEWLTTNKKQLTWNQSYREKQGTLWTFIANVQPSWAKKGEHLSALPAIKRLWPTLFKEEVGRALAAGELGEKKHIGRFVVSTHTMALAHQMSRYFSDTNNLINDESFIQELQTLDSVALPRKLIKQIYKHPQRELIARIPSWLDKLQEKDEEQGFEKAQQQLKKLFGQKAEAYYGLLMMDGDRMGAILSGDDNTQTTISYSQSFHPQVQKGFSEHSNKQPLIAEYGAQKRALSPNRHLAISGALNDFSQTLARHVVEEENLGRLIYAGGDDVLAMLPVVDLLPAMQSLRHAYSGTTPDIQPVDWSSLEETKQLVCKGGFAWLNGRLMRMMGKHATASCGAVIAHHQAPLSAVLRELRTAEQIAKTEGGRNAFSLTIIKRSGGTLYFTEKWGEPLSLLIDLRDFLASEGVSRRLVYHCLEWLKEQQLPSTDTNDGMLETLLSYQINRQTEGEVKQLVPSLADRLTKQAMAWPLEVRVNKLRNFLSVAEFLARETRTGGLAL